ncbi:HNH endonuclease [Nocardioides halotolerans]|uniref:HNH endonuclease n=1 Tax=Nocardioides halotolerans TaxID=433660 RepID=UPI00040E6974|nr:HNH endonuclease signature motif containing protein [Nocardioides halotolerans]
MFELGIDSAPTVDDIHRGTAVVSRIGEGRDDVERIDLMRALEELKCAAEAAQAMLTAAFDRSQREREARAGVPVERRGRAVASQVALARRESPHRGRQHLGLALVLEELPCTRDAFRAGRITEWRVMLLARETACLSKADRGEVDRRMAGDADVLEAMGDGELVSRAREAVYELDPVSFVERRRRAEADRHVGLRPAPDVMSQLSALLPAKDGVAVWAVLGREADQRRAAGDERSRGQIMADTLVRRMLDPREGERSLPLMINVVVPDSVLLGDDHNFGWIEHYGPVPGDLLREWIATNAEDGVDQWVRRLYVAPATGALVAMDSSARRFEGRLADYLRLRDRGCRTRWCDSPVRHLDHALDHADGGLTSAANGQGVCEHCNYAKQALGWSARPRPGPRHTVETVTPTGHRYLSTAPPLTVAERGLRVDFVMTA